MLKRLLPAGSIGAMLLLASTGAYPAENEPAIRGPGAYACVDTPVFEAHWLPRETFHVHERLAQHLASEPRLSQYTCQSQNFVYVARREGPSVRVTSHYRGTNKPHTEIVYLRDRFFGPHGAFRVLWPDARVQALEFYCYGFPVGFHRYFDRRGVLVGVADYSKSDYREVSNPPNAHTFRRDGSMLANPEINHTLSLFREVYAIRGSRIRREHLQAATSLGGWKALDPNSKVEQWTREGHQGTVALLVPRGAAWVAHARYELVNGPIDHVTFAETYQRKKLNRPGRELPTSFNNAVLGCPWLDEAMRFAEEDKRFALAPVDFASA